MTVHVVVSVGWLGAVVSSLALAVIALTSDQVETVGVAYPAMQFIARHSLIPLSLATLLTGVVQSLTTPWGLLRIVVKLALTILGVVVLFTYSQTIAGLADTSRTAADAHRLAGGLKSGSAVLHSGGALVLLMAAVAPSVFKPKGMTRYGQRRVKRVRPVS